MTVDALAVPPAVNEQVRARVATRRKWDSLAREDAKPGWSPEVVEIRAASIDQVQRFAQDVSEILYAFERAYTPPIGAMTNVARLITMLKNTHYRKNA